MKCAAGRLIIGRTIHSPLRAISPQTGQTSFAEMPSVRLGSVDLLGRKRERDRDMESESSKCKRRPRAVFMAFGTKGDVHPIAAIAAAFACDQCQYQVFLITHSAHENLSTHLAAKNVAFLPISSPPVLSAHSDHDDTSGTVEHSFSLQKKSVTRKHREECLNAMDSIFGDDPSKEGDLVVINFFALEGWSLAELFHIRCVVAAPYVVPYSAPSSFERQFMKALPLLYEHLQQAPSGKVCWKDVIHWIWPIFTEDWGSWRSELNLSPCPFTDPVTGLPTPHDWAQSPLLLYGFSKEVVECPGYWPSTVRVCGFWFLPTEWQFSCDGCRDTSVLFSKKCLDLERELCSTHADLQCFLTSHNSNKPIFIGLSSVGSMGLLRNPQAFLHVLEAVLESTSYRFILFTAGYEPLDAAIHVSAAKQSHPTQRQCCVDGVLIFGDRLFCFSGNIPYNWLFQRCSVVIHHGGSGSTAAALHVGVPQVICPFMLDQFYWAERMFWLGVASEPLQKNHLLPDKHDDTSILKAGKALRNALVKALSPELKARASEIAERISLEDGVAEAVKILKEALI